MLKEYNIKEPTVLTDAILKEIGFVWDKGRHCFYIPTNDSDSLPSVEHIWLEYKWLNPQWEDRFGYYVYYGSTLLKSIKYLEELQNIFIALESVELIWGNGVPWYTTKI